MTRSIGESQEAAPRERGTIPEDTFASRLMLARVHAGHQTIDEASAKCGLNRQSWSNWEKGMKPRDLLDVVNAISEGLGVDRDWLLFGGPLAQPDRSRGRRGDITRRCLASGPRTPIHLITGHSSRAAHPLSGHDAPRRPQRRTPPPGHR